MHLSTGSITVTSINDINIATDKPTNPAVDQLWLNISVTPNVLYRYDGTTWIMIDNATYRLEVISSNGTVFKQTDNTRSTTLTVLIYKDNTNITETVRQDILSQSPKYSLSWSRTSSDSTGDTVWNSNHTASTMAIDVTANDIKVNAKFSCYLYENIT